jgi:cobalt/nickel transport system permease protein
MHINLSDQYRPGQSIIHHLDPRVKTVAAVAFILTLSLMPVRALLLYPLFVGLAWTAIVASEVGLGRILKRALVALPFALAALPLVFTTPGPALVQWGGVHLSLDGTARFASILIKSWLSLQMALLLVMTTAFADLLWALRALHLPRVLVSIVGFMYRYLFVLADEASRLLRARAARSGVGDLGKAGGRPAWRARVAGGLVGNLFLRSYERSERVYDAMASRGYTGEIKTLAAPPVKPQDLWISAVLLVPLGIILILSLLIY